MMTNTSPGDRFERTYRCRACGRVERGCVIPHSWYGIARHPRVYGWNRAKCGIFCSDACLLSYAPKIATFDRALTEAGIRRDEVPA